MKDRPPAGSGRAVGSNQQGSVYHPTLFLLPAPVNRALARRNRLAAIHRESPAYTAADFCYNAIEALVKCLRRNRPLSERRQRELGVWRPAEFVWRHRDAFRRLMRLYGVKSIRALLDYYGKRRGCWQFHHEEPPSEVDPGDRGRLLARCHVSNVEPVTWQENMRRRNRRDREEPFEDLLGLWN